MSRSHSRRQQFSARMTKIQWGANLLPTVLIMLYVAIHSADGDFSNPPSGVDCLAAGEFFVKLGIQPVDLLVEAFQPIARWDAKIHQHSLDLFL